MARLLMLIISLFVLAGSAQAASITIDIDTSMASQLLQLTCSGRAVNEAEFASSPRLKDQLAHHAEFGEAYSFENYMEGVRAIAKCEVPDPDPFRFSALVKRRVEMTKAIEFLLQRKEELGARAAAFILPYVPEKTNFIGSVILAPASLSCGGFARDQSFFIDIPCIAENIEGEYNAITRLIAHETYHAIQNQFMPASQIEFTAVKNADQAQEYMFANLALEGSASYIANMLNVTGGGRYAVYSRETTQRNYGHLSYNYKLFDYVIELLSYHTDDLSKRFEDLYGLAFHGRFGQHSYYVGQQIAAEIDHDYGAAALVCVLSLPPENFIIAYQRALAQSDNLTDSFPLAPATLRVAQELAAKHTPPSGLDLCLR